MDANGRHDEQGNIALDPVQPRLGLSPHGAFPRSTWEMKDKLQQVLNNPRYDVCDYYHKTGFTQWLARHPQFEQLTMLVIALNALWIFIDTDYNPGATLINSPPIFQLVEHLFCIYFSFEWVMRFGAFKRKIDGLKDGWFTFDSLLVGTMLVETWVMSAILLLGNGDQGGGSSLSSILRMARLLRLSRMGRMVRLLRAMPELLILCKGMLAAMRSVGVTLSLLFAMLYVFAIAFVQLCESSPCQELFPDVPNSMHTLLLQAALMDGLGNLVAPLQSQSLLLLFVLYLFVLLASLTVMNMLIGVICELVSIVAQTEKESLALSFAWETVNQLIQDADADRDGDGLVSRQEFIGLLENRKAVKILHDCGVDVVGLVDLSDEIFQPEDCDDESTSEKKLTFEELMEHVLEQRGANGATVKDIQRLRKHVNSRFHALERKLLGNRMNSPDSIHASSRDAHIEDLPPCDMLGPPIPRIETTRHPTDGFQDVLKHSINGLLAAHESEVAFLQAENLKLREQMSHLTSSVLNTSISLAQNYCASQSNSDAHFGQEIVETCNPRPVLPGVASQASSSKDRRVPESPATSSDIRQGRRRGVEMAMTNPGAFGTGTALSGQSRDSSVGSSDRGMRCL